MTLPNHLTLLRILLSPVFFFLFTSEDNSWKILSLAVFIVAALTDWYDGSLARRRNEITRLGKFLDPLADKFLTSAGFLALAQIHLVEWWMVWVIVIRDFVVTLLRTTAEAMGYSIKTVRSAQVKTFIQMTVLYYLLLLSVGKSALQHRMEPLLNTLLDPFMVYYIMLAVTVITALSGVQYLFDNRSILGRMIGIPKRVAE